MEKLKVVSKAKVLEALKDGCKIMYNTLSAKAYLIDADKNTMGAIRFNTFLSIDKQEVENRIYSHNTYYTLKN